jgi:hypothetical protein
MTPDEAAMLIKSIIVDDDSDQEMRHVKMDMLFCEILTELGYTEAVTLFENEEKWYA